MKVGPLRRAFIRSLATITRRFHPRGTGRMLRVLCPPDKGMEAEFVLSYDADLKMHLNTKSFIEWCVIFWGYYEPEITELIRRYLPQGGTFVDVGANVGVHTLVGAKTAGEVIAIEPVSEIADRLQANLDLNGISKVKILRLVVSDKEGKVLFYLPRLADANRGVGSLHKAHAKGGAIEVLSSTLDRLLDGKSVHLIKIDTEGHDARVILGGAETIRKNRPVVVFEYDKNAWEVGGVSLDKAKSVFENYDFQTLGGGDRYNVLCVPKERYSKQ